MEQEVSWYLPDLENGDVMGPLSQDEVEIMLTKDQIGLDDFIWGSHLKFKRWYRIFEVEEFKHHLVPPPTVKIPRHLGAKSTEQSLRKDFQSGHFGNENIYRRYPRAPLDVEVLVHDHQKLLRGHTTDISEKGASIILPAPASFEKGAEVTLTFRSVPHGVGTFSATAAILRVDQEGTECRYGLFFLRTNPRVRRMIARYIMKSFASESPAKQESA